MSYNINLASKLESNTIDKIVDFFFNYLRYALVLTMLVLLGVFFFRLRIDQNIEELEDSISQKRQIFEIVKPMINHASEIDSKMSVVGTIINAQDKQLALFEFIYSQFPKELFLTRLSYDTESLIFSGQTSDPRVLELYYKKLKSYPPLTSIVLNKVQRTERGYEFTFTINLAKS